MTRPALSWSPGYYGLSLSDHAREALSAIASAMVPGTEEYPPGGNVGVADFVSERVNPKQRDVLEDLLADLDPSKPEGATEWLSELAERDQVTFSMLRTLVYTAYYRSPLVLAVLRAHGFDYHGAPQPHGYQVAADIPLPTHGRGSFFKTDEVTNVLNDRAS